MYPHSLLWHCLWIAPHVLTIAVVWLLVRDRQAKEFPFFLSYAILQVIEQPILFMADHSSRVSATGYWIIYGCLLLPQIALRFGIIYELFRHMVKFYPALQRFGLLSLRWMAVILILLAAVFSGLQPGTRTNHLLSAISILSRAVSLVQSGLLVFLFVFASALGLSWRSHAFGIAVGLGLYSTVNLVVDAMVVWLGAGGGTYALDMVSMVAYQCSVLIWIFYLFSPEPARVAIRDMPQSNMTQWNAELERMLSQ